MRASFSLTLLFPAQVHTTHRASLSHFFLSLSICYSPMKSLSAGSISAHSASSSFRRATTSLRNADGIHPRAAHLDEATGSTTTHLDEAGESICVQHISVRPSDPPPRELVAVGGSCDVTPLRMISLNQDHYEVSIPK
jgi:hypothetical protein